MDRTGPAHRPAHRPATNPLGPRRGVEPRSADRGCGMSAHYHVFAVQDLGGSQESWTDWDDHFTAAEANQHLNDIFRADVMSQNGHAAEARAEFGERYSDLVSDNVASGWDRVIAVCCAEACRFGELFAETGLV